MTVLGLDPGSSHIGFGVIEKERGGWRHRTSGLLSISGNGEKRFTDLARALETLLEKHHPDLAGIERLFFTKNRKTAIEVAQARGVIIYLLARHAVPIVEFTPSEMKLSVTGNGNANKKEVAKMVSYFLRIPTSHLIDDVTDALALAIAASTSFRIRKGG